MVGAIYRDNEGGVVVLEELEYVIIRDWECVAGSVIDDVIRWE